MERVETGHGGCVGLRNISVIPTSGERRDRGVHV